MPHLAPTTTTAAPARGATTDAPPTDPALAATGVDVRSGLSDVQQVAVDAIAGPVCIIAGAGSGKTRTITHRIANQVHRGLARPDQVLALTFTERAAAELQSRLRALGIPGSIRATTFHAAAFAQVRYFWPRARNGPLPSVLDRKVGLLLPLARRTSTEASDLATEIEWAKARRIAPDDYEAAGRGRDAPLPPAQMAAVYARYEELKSQRDLMDFDDMLAIAGDLMSDDEVAAVVRRRYRYFTVDEFQDVNPAQWWLLRLWLGDRDDLCVVGDEDQTIYSFSGATSEYLRGFATTFPRATVVTLDDNYRSSGQVLTVANRLLRAGRVDAKQLRAQHHDGPEPTIVACDDDAAERRRTLDWVRELLDAGVSADEIAVCLRTNSQTQSWEESFATARVPARVHGDRTFFQRPEIVQALAALHAAVASPPAPVGATPPQPGTRPAPRRAERVVEQVFAERLSWHPQREPTGRAARQRWRNVSALFELVDRVVDEHDDDVPLDTVVAALDERARVAGGRHPGAPSVTLLTLHKAKGSEFDAVCLVGLEEGLMPISYASTDEEVAEERRLLYVGMTRARRYLWMSWARERPGWGGRMSKRRRSRFLDDVDPAPAPDLDLAGSIRAWRRDRARRDDVPPYVVFGDRTLRELASVCPTSPTELLAVHGLGATKVQRYGAELLALLAAPGRKT